MKAVKRKKDRPAEAQDLWIIYEINETDQMEIKKGSQISLTQANEEENEMV